MLLSALVVPATASASDRERAADLPSAVVALGDSYSSGLGAGHYDDDCDRTARAWSMVIFGDTVTDRSLLACSGATIPDVALQVERLRALPGEPGDRLITLTVGGNDVGFADELVNCLVSFLSCVRREAVLMERIAGLHGPLVELYRSIQAAAPGDEIIVGGYPMLVADPAVRSDCPALTGLLSVSERQMIRRLGVALNDVIDAAADDAGARSAAGELEQTFDGHEACANGSDDWLYGLRISWRSGGAELPTDGPHGEQLSPSYETRRDVLVSVVKESFHPNPAGQAGYAVAFEAEWFSG